MRAALFSTRIGIRVLVTRVVLCASGCVALLNCNVPAIAAEAANAATPVTAAIACTTFADLPTSAYPAIAKGCGEQLAYVGAYMADGKYYTGEFMTALVHSQTRPLDQGLRPADVPRSVNLHARERLVEDLRAGSPARRVADGQSRWAEWRDQIVTAVYGHEKTVVGPQNVTTDSEGRVVVSDPAGGAVHVLDRVRPFRIAVGPQYRLRHAGAVAADSRDHIFVSDPVEGIIVEFDASGRFVREIGRIGENEGLFYSPAGLHIDESDLLYVADTGREMLLVLNPDGRVVRRAGGKRREMGVSFVRPMAVAASNGHVAVLDSDGTRVQVLDGNCGFVKSFNTGMAGAGIALDLDSEGNIYLSNAREGRVRVFSATGVRKGEFGRHGFDRGDLQAASGISIDVKDRLYVSDTENRRVNVFQINWASTAAVREGGK
jgi:DNA-binding beta-propeller fold protein YncE